MPSNVPLPSGATFKLVVDLSDNSGAAKDWYWTVDSPNTLPALRDFYQSNLSSNGWSQILANGPDGGYFVTGCNGNQAIYVSLTDSAFNFSDAQGNLDTVTAPAGGSAMRIRLSSQPDTLDVYGCK